MQILNKIKLRYIYIYISETFRHQEKCTEGTLWNYCFLFSLVGTFIRNVQCVFVHLYDIHLNICYVKVICLC
jgi:hypothetical protein